MNINKLGDDECIELLTKVLVYKVPNIFRYFGRHDCIIVPDDNFSWKRLKAEILWAMTSIQKRRDMLDRIVDKAENRLNTPMTAVKEYVSDTLDIPYTTT